MTVSPEAIEAGCAATRIMWTGHDDALRAIVTGALQAAAPLLRQPKRTPHPPVERVLFAVDNLPVAKKSLRWLANAVQPGGTPWGNAPGVFGRLMKRGLVELGGPDLVIATEAGRALLAMLERRP